MGIENNDKMVGRGRFELPIPWNLASEQMFTRPKPRIIANLDHRPLLDRQTFIYGYKNNGQVHGDSSGDK